MYVCACVGLRVSVSVSVCMRVYGICICAYIYMICIYSYMYIHVKQYRQGLQDGVELYDALSL